MLNVLYEDNHIIVVLKPQNVASQGDESGDQNMLDMVKDYVKQTKNKPGNVFVGLVHRLDRPTGGVMVFAKTSKAASRLTEQIKTGEMHKKYLAVVQGVPKNSREHLVNYLLKNPKKNTVSVVPQTTTNAKRAELEYKLVGSCDGYSLLEINLITGRSHQIRVQLSHIGFPLYADVKYGANSAKGQNLGLWAYELKLVHPTTQMSHTFKSIPPTSAMPWVLFENLSVFK